MEAGFFSYINSADAFQWEKTPATFPKQRLLEYTDDFVRDRFWTKNGNLSDAILKYPALFGVEAPHGVAAKVGWIERIDWKLSDPVIYFRLDDRFRPIQQSELEGIKWELGITDFEFYRTHWAVKQADLLSVLQNRGFRIESRQDEGTLANKVEKRAIDSRPAQVFVSYAHVDSLYLKRLNIHLSPLKRWVELQVWDDTNLEAGDNWKEEIAKALSECTVAILLVSADFLASDFISHNELPPLLQKAKEAGARIIPVILKPCLYTSHPELKNFQAINSPENSLVGMTEVSQEELWTKVSRTVLDLVTKP